MVVIIVQFMINKLFLYMYHKVNSMNWSKNHKNHDFLLNSLILVLWVTMPWPPVTIMPFLAIVASGAVILKAKITKITFGAGNPATLIVVSCKLGSCRSSKVIVLHLTLTTHSRSTASVLQFTVLLLWLCFWLMVREERRTLSQS